MEFVECFSQSAFSFREGASLPEEMVQEAARLSLRGLGLCDRGGVYGLVRAWKEAQKFQLPLLHGTLLSVEGLPDIGLLAENAIDRPWNEREYMRGLKREDREQVARVLAPTEAPSVPLRIRVLQSGLPTQGSSCAECHARIAVLFIRIVDQLWPSIRAKQAKNLLESLMGNNWESKAISAAPTHTFRPDA